MTCLPGPTCSGQCFGPTGGGLGQLWGPEGSTAQNFALSFSLAFPSLSLGEEKKREIFGAPPYPRPAPLVEGRLVQKAKTPIWAKDGSAKVCQLRMAEVGSAKVGISLLLGTGTTFRIGNSFLGVHGPVLTVESWLKCRNCEMRNALVAAWSHKEHV